MKQAKLIQRLKDTLNSNEVGIDVDTQAELGWPFSSFHMLKTMAEMKSPLSHRAPCLPDSHEKLGTR